MQKLLNYNYLYLIPLFLSSMAGLRSFRPAGLKALRPLAALLVLTLAVEFFAIGWKWSWHTTAYWNYSNSNLWLYNAFLLAWMPFYMAIYYKALVSTRLKKAILYGTGPLVIFGLVNYIFIQHPDGVDNYTIILYQLVIVFLSLAYFHQVLHQKEITRLRSNPMVWISLGTFLYHSGSLPFFVLLGFLNKSNATFAYSLLYINTALNTLMYTFYLISFLCKPPIHQ